MSARLRARPRRGLIGAAILALAVAALVAILTTAGGSAATGGRVTTASLASFHRAMVAKLDAQHAHFEWVACVQAGSRFEGVPVVRCNVEFGDPHVQAYCSVFRGGRLRDQRRRSRHPVPGRPCGLGLGHDDSRLHDEARAVPAAPAALARGGERAAATSSARTRCPTAAAPSCCSWPSSASPTSPTSSTSRASPSSPASRRAASFESARPRRTARSSARRSSRGRWPSLAAMERRVGNLRVRNVGTIGGNLCFADPHSDPATYLIAADGAVTVRRGGAPAPADPDRGVRHRPVRDDARARRAADRRPRPRAGAADSVLIHRKMSFHERPAITVAVHLDARGRRRSPTPAWRSDRWASPPCGRRAPSRRCAASTRRRPPRSGWATREPPRPRRSRRSPTPMARRSTSAIWCAVLVERSAREALESLEG